MSVITTEMHKVEDWESSNIQVFWGEIAPCEHLVQFYDNDATFLNTLEGFAGSGLISDDAVIILGTESHISSLNMRLSQQGFDVEGLIRSDKYIPIDVKEIFSTILINGWLDETLFENYVIELIKRAKQKNRKVRAFGELVAILWEQGHCGVTVQLENLWHRLYHKLDFTLYCAYPKIGFTQSPGDSINIICKSHSKLIDGEARPSTEIYYKTA